MTDSYFSLPKISGKYRLNVDLSKTNWFGVGGRVKVVFFPKDINDLQFFLQNKPEDLRIIILGVGSNIIVKDGEINACVIKLNFGFTDISYQNNILEVGTGVLSRNLANYCKNNSLTNLEFLTGIPGSIGGAIRMNSGCYGAEVADFLEKMIAIDFEGNIFEFLNEDCDFSYRECKLLENLIFLKAFFRVEKGDVQKISKQILDFNRKREETQPIRAKTGGSTFKNPPNMKAWELIDQAGCRGKKIGDAEMSEKHCNFMINHGSNNANDLINLSEYVIDKVLEKTGVKLEMEIKIIS
ncbi:MAG: UDP-N-acetylmuramate dehydrogenase [Rickettsiales bacterium]|jgi:UDP-N-acetylmuramate dehydrogenase